MANISKNMRDDLQNILITEEELDKRVRELAEEISRDYEGKDLLLICILKGAVVFFSDLVKRITVPLKFDFMSISSYGDARKTSGIVRIAKDVDTSITGRDVLIVEDIMDSGLTLNHLTKVLSARNPASMKIVCLLDKPERRECDITPDYRGFEIPNEFVVGYGLDYASYYRNLPFVGVLKPSVYS